MAKYHLWRGVARRGAALLTAAVALLLAAGAVGAQSADAPWRANLTCPPERQASQGVEYCLGQDEKGQTVHVVVVDLASPTVRFEYVLPEGIAIRYQNGRELERSATAEECRDPNVPDWGGPAGGCSLANNADAYPRLTLAQAVARAEALGREFHQGLPPAVVINADYGAPDATHGPEGLVVVRGQRLDGAANCDDDFNAALRPWLGLAERRGITGALRADIDRLPTDAAPLPAWLHTGIGGGPMLVQNGLPYDGAARCTGQQPLAQPEPMTGCNLNQKTGIFPNMETYAGGSCRRAPHTAAGISRDRRWLFLAISTGDDAPDVLARFMISQLAVDEALKFDGGGSSQVWLAGQPPLTLDVGRDGRPLTNFLAVYAPPLAASGLVATPLDATTYLTLDEGETATLDPTFRNDGATVWRAEEGVALVEVGLGGNDPTYPLPRAVAPGESVSWAIPADESGIHVRRFQMAQHGVPFGEPAQFLVVVIPAALREQSDEIQRELERIFDEARQQGEAELEEVAQRIQAWLVEEGQRLAENAIDGLIRAAQDALNSACAGALLLPGLAGLVLVGARGRRN